MNKIIYLLILGLFIACSSNENSKPIDLMTENQMINFLFDINIINSMSNVASPHLNNDKTLSIVEPEQWDPEKINGAAGSIYSNVNDIANWMLHQMHFLCFLKYQYLLEMLMN